MTEKTKKSYITEAVELTTATSFSHETIGEILRRKRRELKMEIADVCTYLKVKEHDIEAIENEKWNKVTNHLYKTGLIRSYAKFLKIDPQIIEEKIKSLPFESNIKNSKHRLLNIGEETDLTPNRDMFFNFLLISSLMFLILLAIYNASERKGRLLPNEKLILELEKVQD